MKHLKGRRSNGPVPTCMVVGCNKKAIYKNPGTARRAADRGYCSAHRQLAIIPQQAYSRQSHGLESYLKRHDDGWVPICGDGKRND